ncbi:MAG TPA: AAA family ATPase [Candidatus Saccharimonadales bacterium]|nr:AAA family ATPase [Candidatus Saccharimonadales bacterium]
MGAHQHIIAVTNQKGGVGKTTTAVNVAAQLATPKRRVVLVDLDPQGNATSSLGIDKERLDSTLYDVLISSTDVANIVLPTNIPNLFLLPANAQLAQAEVDLVPLQRREFRLAEVLKAVEAEVVLVDCPPALGLLTINALTAANQVLIPVQSEYFALEGLGQLLQTVQAVKQSLNPRLEILGVVLTMFNKRMTLSEQVQAEVAQHFGDKLFKTIVPRNVRLAEAPSYGRTIFEHDKWSKGARAYKNLAAEISKRLG